MAALSGSAASNGEYGNGPWKSTDCKRDRACHRRLVRLSVLSGESLGISLGVVAEENMVVLLK